MTHDLWIYALMAFTGFFAIMNPIANLPVFIALVGDADKKTIRSIAIKGTFTAFIIVASFVFMGKFIFDIFHITIPAFKITGGILLFFVGFEMLQSKRPTVGSKSNYTVDQGVAISPLAIPLLAGPGTIVTAMSLVAGETYLHIGIVMAVFAFMIILTYLSFISSDFIIKKLGNNFILVVGKIMGLILSIIGIDMMIEGIKLAFKLN